MIKKKKDHFYLYNIHFKKVQNTKEWHINMRVFNKQCVRKLFAERQPDGTGQAYTCAKLYNLVNIIVTYLRRTYILFCVITACIYKRWMNKSLEKLCFNWKIYPKSNLSPRTVNFRMYHFVKVSLKRKNNLLLESIRNRREIQTIFWKNIHTSKTHTPHFRLQPHS